MINYLCKLGVKEIILTMIKGICNKSMVNIILTDEIMKTFPKIENKINTSTLITYIQYYSGHQG